MQRRGEHSNISLDFCLIRIDMKIQILKEKNPIQIIVPKIRNFYKIFRTE